jgi:hypothetical protein
MLTLSFLVIFFRLAYSPRVITMVKSSVSTSITSSVFFIVLQCFTFSDQSKQLISLSIKLLHGILFNLLAISVRIAHCPPLNTLLLYMDQVADLVMVDTSINWHTVPLAVDFGARGCFLAVDPILISL